MRVSAIKSYGVYNKTNTNIQKKTEHNTNLLTKVNNQNPSFKGCNIFKVVGFLAGAAACVVLAPGLAAVGLAGVGALPGAIAGAAIDDKIDEIDDKDRSK